MKTVTTNQFCFLESKLTKQVQPMTPEKFDEVIGSEKVKELMKRIEEEPDYEKKNELKNELPAAIFACACPIDGVRPKRDTGITNGLCMHDWDKIGVDPRAFYLEHVAGREEALGIVLVHVTPRGEGLRVVSLLPLGQSIAQCQTALAAQFGMSHAKDEKCKDVSRISFMVSDDYILYRNDALLFGRGPVTTDMTPQNGDSSEQMGCQNGNTLEQACIGNQAETSLLKQQSGIGDQAETTALNQGVALDKSFAQSLTYQGLTYDAIITELLNRLATNGQPVEGERNDDLYAAARELRHLTNYNFQTTHALLSPYFPTLSDQEKRRTIGSAIGSTGRSITPTMKGIIAQLRSNRIDEEGEALPWPKMPQVPPVMQMLASHYPKELAPHVVLSSLPILGLYGTHIRFPYLDNRMNSLSFQAAVYGRSGQGKSYAWDLVSKMTKRFEAQDKVEREKNNEYAQQMDLGVKGDGKAPKDPRAKVRLFGDDITTSQMLDYLEALGGEHGFQYTDEVSRLTKARKTRYADNDDIYCKAFENAIGGKESKSRQTRNIRIPIYLNTLFCGTTKAMHDFYNNPEGGMNNRVIFNPLPAKRHRGVPRYESLTVEEQKQLEETFDKLWALGTRPGEESFRLDYIERAFTSWIAKCDRENDENPDQTWRDLANRASVIGFRAAVLAHFLWDVDDNDEVMKRKVVKFGLWVAMVQRIAVFNFCGNEYDKINQQEEQQTPVRQTHNKKFLSLLPTKFTIQDIINQRILNGEPVDANPRMLVKRWMDAGLVRREGDHYVKVKCIS